MFFREVVKLIKNSAYASAKQKVGFLVSLRDLVDVSISHFTASPPIYAALAMPATRKEY